MLKHSNLKHIANIPKIFHISFKERHIFKPIPKKIFTIPLLFNYMTFCYFHNVNNNNVVVLN